MRKQIFGLIVAAALVAIAGESHAWNLNWKDNSGNMPGCSSSAGACDAEDGFIVQKLASGATAFAELDRVGANVTAYVDKAGQPGDCYRIAAFNVAGISGFSSVACAKLKPGDPSDLQLSMEFPVSFSGTLKNKQIAAASKSGYKLVATIGKKNAVTATVTR